MNVWYGVIAVYEGEPVAMGGWVLTDRHSLASCATVGRRFGYPKLQCNWMCCWVQVPHNNITETSVVNVLAGLRTMCATMQEYNAPANGRLGQ